MYRIRACTSGRSELKKCPRFEFRATTDKISQPVSPNGIPKSSTIARSNRVWVKGGGGQRRVGRPRPRPALRSRTQFDGLGSNSIARGMDDGGTKRRRPGFLRVFQSGEDVQNVKSQRRAGHPALQQFNTKRLALNTSALPVSSTLYASLI